MTFLRDKAIASELQPGSPLASEVDASNYEAKEAPIQACSLDLTIGDIFDPGAASGKPGSADHGRIKLSLGQGATAVIRTKEILKMPNDVGGIAFPPSQVSIEGLLMTNPGHVDPGYDGHLHLTVINMGRQNYQLKRGDRIVRLLLFKLSEKPEKSYRERRAGAPSTRSVITEELLSHLSNDFVDVTRRADASARNAQIRTAIWVPIVAALAGAGITILVNQLSGGEVKQANQKIDALSARVDALGGDINLGNMQNEIRQIQNRIGP